VSDVCETHEPVRSEIDPNIYKCNGRLFDLRSVLMCGHTMESWARVEEWCEVPSPSLYCWWERVRPKDWQDKFIEAFADAARAKKRKDGTNEPNP